MNIVVYMKYTMDSYIDIASILYNDHINHSAIGTLRPLVYYHILYYNIVYTIH